jgi:hypothetical protein
LNKRNEYTNEKLLKDLRLSEPSDFQNFLQLDATSFDELLKIITSQTEKRNTTMRDAIPPSQRLSVILRYIATGNTFEDLKFSSAVSLQSIGTALTHSLLMSYIRGAPSKARNLTLYICIYIYGRDLLLGILLLEPCISLIYA